MKLDDKNPTTLTDLASIELQLNDPQAAEKYLKTALAADPNDNYSLFVLGQLKFAQHDYDEALNALSRAAQMSPQNPQVQNFLGMTLSEKGLRGPAEPLFAVPSKPTRPLRTRTTTSLLSMPRNSPRCWNWPAGIIKRPWRRAMPRIRSLRNSSIPRGKVCLPPPIAERGWADFAAYPARRRLTALKAGSRNRVVPPI